MRKAAAAITQTTSVNWQNQFKPQTANHTTTGNNKLQQPATETNDMFRAGLWQAELPVCV
jgi:hypothetical protein